MSLQRIGAECRAATFKLKIKLASGCGVGSRQCTIKFTQLVSRDTLCLSATAVAYSVSDSAIAIMPQGSISSSLDAVGVAVVNYKVPVCESHEDIIDNCNRIAKQIDGAKLGYPGLDLIIFPEYSTQVRQS